MFRQLLTIFFFLPIGLFGQFSQLQLDCSTVLLMNAKTGGIVFEKKGYELCYPASLTKIATALYVLDSRVDLDQMCLARADELVRVTEYDKMLQLDTIPPHQLETNAVHMYIKDQEVLPLRNLLEGHIMSSACDASNVIAQNLHGSVEDFMQHLNAYLQKKGYPNTQLLNPNGLHHPAHYSTPLELARMFKETLKFPCFRHWIQSTHYFRPKTNKQPAKKMFQINRLVKKGRYYYPKAFGGKTGYHKQAGYSLIAAAEFQGDELIVVLLGGHDPVQRYLDAVKLFESAFMQTKVKRKFLQAGMQPFTVKPMGSKKSIKTWIKEDVFIETYPTEDLDIEQKIEFKSIELPVKKYEPVGWVHFISSTVGPIKSVPLLAANDVNPMLLHTFLKSLKNMYAGCLPYTNRYAVGLLVILFIVLLRRYFLKKRQPFIK